MEEVNNPTEEEFNRLKEDGKKQAIAEMEGGAILLRNNEVNGEPALPLKKGASISLFGHGSEDPLCKPYSGGPGRWNTTNTFTWTNLYDGLKQSGFNINDTLYNAYAEARASGGYGVAGNYGSGTRKEELSEKSFELFEVSPDFYDQSGIRESYANYDDAAIVCITRTAGENRDCPTGRGNLDAPGFIVEDPSRSYLELTAEEEAMFEEVKADFDKIIVVFNSANIVEAGWLDEYDVDACIYTAGYGQYGTIGLANILCGDANPSGRLVDTWAYDFMSAPAMTNFGNFTYTNASQMLTSANGVTEGLDKTSHYVVYAEGIYVGYKYYETRYEDTILGRGGADSSVGSTTGGDWNYAEEVQFPFGYGLSYTTFSLELLSGSYDEKSVGSEFTFEVKVTNTGDVAGRRSVQLYFQAPYEENGVEKSAIQLVGFEKTGVLQPGGSETVTITVDKYLLASYDYEVADGYILDPGNYYFAVGDSAHDALNHILKAKGATGMVNHDGTAYAPDDLNKVWTWEDQKVLDTETYRYSRWSDNGAVEVTNRLEEMDINYWLPGTVTYLTRSDWSGTYPTEPTEITLTAEMAREIGGNYYEDIIPEDAPSVDDFTQGATENGISFVSMYGVDYDDPIWEDFLDQLTVAEMLTVVGEHWATEEVLGVNKPYHWNDDGPDGVHGGYKVYNDEGLIPYINGECTLFCNEVILASTYDKELIRNRGLLLGEESMFATCPQLWSPGADLHRTAFGGRNFEYYSEDSYMSYICASIEVAAMREKGVVTAIKHCAGNNQETNRQGLCTFSNEQAFRMNDMRGFEGAFTIGKSNGTMTSFNRIGMRAFSQSNVMQQEVLRGEWGFKGVIISDAVDIYMHSRESLAAGNDMWCLAGWTADGERNTKAVREAIEGGDGYMLQCLREANKHFYYAYCNSNLTNGLSTDTVIVPVKNWWETTLETAEIVMIVLTVIFAGMFIGSTVTKAVAARKEKADA